jgi:predicted AlkP superfamily phosphohydrolase/phosphomutase
MESGDLPALASLAQAGAWRRVISPAFIGSGSVWPTFITGTDPSVHGVYAEWAWQPVTMSVKRYSGSGLVPFWTQLLTTGRSVGMFDVPFAPLVGMPGGFEVTEWGPHDAFEGHVSAAPEVIAALVSARPPHPFYSRPVDPTGPHDTVKLAALLSACLDGVRARGDLLRSLVTTCRPELTVGVFNEIHHASHYLWHAFASDHPVYAGLPATADQSLKEGMKALYREVDRQIGQVVGMPELNGADVVVFSLHGMRPAHGVVSLLAPWLVERGYATLSGWREKTWRERAISTFGAAKRHSPQMLRSLYYRLMPANATRQLAQPTMLPAYDWRKTRAFALPTDQHGWIRVNLRGREARGIVETRDYEGLIAELRSDIESLTDDAGRPLVTRTLRTCDSADAAATSALPDLVVHWADAALASPLRIRGSAVDSSAIGHKFTSQHALEGFLIARGSELAEGETVRGADLHAVITGPLRAHH